jgi:hypothetical protein
MDQTAVYLEMKNSKTIAIKGTKDIAVREGKGTTQRITVRSKWFPLTKTWELQF